MANTDLRSGGQGGGTKEAPRYQPPPDFKPQIILSDKSGVTKKPLAQTDTNTIPEPTIWIQPETMTGLESDKP